MSGVYWVSGMKCRYSGARRSISGIRGHWGTPRGVGCQEAIRGCQGCIGGLAESVGTQGS